MYEFRWNDWNLEHIAEHGVTPVEAEYVVNHARSPWPMFRGDDKWLAAGQTAARRYLQVIFIFDPADLVFVVHARPLTEREKRRCRRRKR